jgi:CRP/FNR family transcriptional regulator, cyclic AMP receptor protein
LTVASGARYCRASMELDSPEVRESIAAGPLADVPEPVLQELLRRGRFIEAPTGMVARRPGDAPRLCIIVDGLVRVHLDSGSGRQLTIRDLRGGDISGLAQLMARLDTLHMVALSPTRAWTALLEDVRDLFAQEPALIRAVARECASRLDDLTHEIADVCFGSLRQRLLRHLLDAAVPADDGQLICRLSQRELGDAMGSVREIASRVIRELKSEGLVAMRPDGIALLDCAVLYRESVR